MGATMPIRPENKARYPKDWPAISNRIREREGQKCKWCLAPNFTLIYRGEGLWAGSYMLETGDLHDDKTGEHLGIARGSEYEGKIVQVVLTVAHLDHCPENCTDENLAALCQKCHNTYDMPMRRRGIRERAHKARAIGDLLETGNAPTNRQD
jgi:hypothetical protein